MDVSMMAPTKIPKKKPIVIPMLKLNRHKKNGACHKAQIHVRITVDLNAENFVCK